jgi:hypothetical protein
MTLPIHRKVLFTPGAVATAVALAGGGIVLDDRAGVRRSGTAYAVCFRAAYLSCN